MSKATKTGKKQKGGDNTVSKIDNDVEKVKTDFINEKEFISLSKDCEELIMIIVSIIKSSKQKI